MMMQVFQTLVIRWISRAFGDESSKDKRERTHRFLEESLELGQAAGATQHEAHALVEYVYGRPAGKAEQEVGGVLLTLAGFCAAHGLELHRCAAAEIWRVNRPEVLEKCRIKQAAKKADPLASPLPGQPRGAVRVQPPYFNGRELLEPARSKLRAEVAAGVGHDCGEWFLDGRCQLCDGPEQPKTIETGGHASNGVAP